MMAHHECERYGRCYPVERGSPSMLQTVLIPNCLGVTAWLAVVGQQGRPCWFQGRNGVDQLHGLLAVGTVSDWVVVHGARHGLAY